MLRELTPDIPVTTNFMVMGETKGMDYADWAAEVDFVSNDHYAQPGPQARDELSFSANLTGSLAGGRPWFLMEHSTSAVNWQPVNVAKRPGELARDSLTHVAHGADAVCFFQWRQSAAGAEKYHSAMVPHAGRRQRGLPRRRRARPDAARRSRRSPAPARTPARVGDPVRLGVVVGERAGLAPDVDRLRYRAGGARLVLGASLDLGVRADVVTAGADLDRLRPASSRRCCTSSPRALAERLDARTSRGGGHLVTTYFSGIVDEHDHVWLGGYPGALRDLLGIRIEEFGAAARRRHASTWTTAPPAPCGPTGSPSPTRTSRSWPATAPATYAGRPGRHPPARPAPARPRTSPPGSARTASARLLPELLDAAPAWAANCRRQPRGRVELAVRVNDACVYRFLVNRTDQPVVMPMTAGQILVGGGETGTVTLAARGVAVIHRDR